ncbi:MAG: hypothetical protein EHM41_08920 [Chloroflexi bacterium]|nr:MAG: hypothetical protein EHM41_08920 [Chloroflexota bacterium]
MEIVKPRVDQMVGEFTGDFISGWWSSPSIFPSTLPLISASEQFRREKDLQSHLDSLYAIVRKPPHNSDEETRGKLEDLVIHIFQSALGFEERHTDAVLEAGFREAITGFSEQARRFDSEISDEDIYQAARNSTSMNLMQILLRLPVEVTPSVFAYSMLYPYTDNYLDDPAVSKQVKHGFNERFRRRIAGEDVYPDNPREERILQMIDLIEGEYSRERFPQVYDSLLAIQSAQTNSLRLMDRSSSPYEVDVLCTVVMKGGTSALADGFLVAGDLTPEQARFTYDYGAFTQLMDDLEDVHADLQAGIQTLYSQTAGKWPLDRLVNKTLNIGLRVLEELGSFPGKDLDLMKEILHLSFNPILIDSAACAGPYLSRQ